MRTNLGKLAAASLLGGLLLSPLSPAAAQDWRDGRGIWHHGRYYVPAPPPRYAPPPPAYVPVPVAVPVYNRPVYGNPGYYHRPVAYRHGCNSWWHWDRYRRGYVRVTNC